LKEVKKMAQKYVVTMTEEERVQLKEMIRQGKVSGFRMRHAGILLKLDAGRAEGWTYETIAKAHGTNLQCINHIAKRFVEEGLESALSRKPQENRARKIDGESEARIVALVCGGPPQGHAVWTLRLLRDEIVRLEIVEDISHVGVHNLLKKTNLSLGGKKNGVSPKSLPSSSPRWKMFWMCTSDVTTLCARLCAWMKPVGN
jgi:transposase